MAPAVSVVIATYNRANYLASTLDSVLAQKFSDFEIIVVDDGSTDDTPGVMAGYRSRVTYYHQENQGASAARNFGVQRAQAPWIAIQDSDDLSLSNHLEALYRYVEKHADTGLVFANGEYLGGPVHNRETIIPEAKSRRLAGRAVRLADLFDKSIFRLQAGLISKKCYLAVGGLDEGLRICHDLSLAFRLWMHYPIAYLDEVVFAYRKHDSNISSDPILRLTENIRVIEDLCREFPKAEQILGRHRVHARLAYRYYRLAKTQMKNGKTAAARQSLRTAVGLSSLNPKYRLYQLQWAAVKSRT